MYQFKVGDKVMIVKEIMCPVMTIDVIYDEHHELAGRALTSTPVWLYACEAFVAAIVKYIGVQTHLRKSR